MNWTEEEMCKEAVKELKDGYYVNLGVGLPTLVANYVPAGMEIIFHSENGILGVGPFPTKSEVDPDLINAGKQTVTELPYTCFFDSATSFAIVRSGHINVTMLGGLQVSQKGDLANWSVPGKLVRGMGGAMDLVAGVGRVVVMMTHLAKDGSPKVLKECSFPLTGRRVVDKVVTDMCIFEIAHEKMTLVQMAPKLTVHDIVAATEADFFYEGKLYTHASEPRAASKRAATG